MMNRRLNDKMALILYKNNIQQGETVQSKALQLALILYKNNIQQLTEEDYTAIEKIGVNPL